jgi:diguanylate cyclase (GGDEF)-like protein
MSQDFSIQAINTAAFITNITLAVIMVHARATRRVYPGFNDWMTSQILLAASIILLSVRAYLSPWISLVLGNSLLMLAQVFVYTGTIRFFNLPNYRHWPYYGLVAVATVGFAWLIATDAPGSQRSLLFSVFIAFMMARIAVALFMHKKERKDPSVLLLLAAVLLPMVFFSARSLIICYVGFDNTFWNLQLLAASFYVAIIYSSLLAFSFLQLVQARTESELQAAQSKAEELANTDPLTGAWNRRRFEYEAEREMAKANRYQQPLALTMFDIDHFKTINDRDGHQAGDAILQRVCSLVRQQIRGTDSLVRWGGDEFLILMPMTYAADAEELAERLRASVALQQFGRASKITLSMGVAEYRPGEPLEEWLARADRSVYIAKAQGRDQVVSNLPPPQPTKAN